MHVKLCPQGPDNLAAEIPALKMRLLWALSAVAMNTRLWYTGARRHVSIRQDQCWGLWSLARSWFRPGATLQAYLGRVQRPRGVSEEIGGGGLLGISQDSAASDSSSRRQQGNFLALKQSTE